MIPRQNEDRLDDDDFNSLNSHEDFLFESEDDLYSDDHLLTDEYDDDELERRRSAYADLKKNDKIFNNTYNFGLDTAEDEDEGAEEFCEELAHGRERGFVRLGVERRRGRRGRRGRRVHGVAMGAMRCGRRVLR